VGLPVLPRSSGRLQALTSRAVKDDLGFVSSPGNRLAGKRAQRLKDLLLDKELQNEINTAEFALKLDLPQPETGGIDYEKLADKLEKSLELLDRRQSRISGMGAEQAVLDLTKRLEETKGELENVLGRVRESMGRREVGHVEVSYSRNYSS
jgi:hypothetical protein